MGLVTRSDEIGKGDCLPIMPWVEEDANTGVVGMGFNHGDDTCSDAPCDACSRGFNKTDHPHYEVSSYGGGKCPGGKWPQSVGIGQNVARADHERGNILR